MDKNIYLYILLGNLESFLIKNREKVESIYLPPKLVVRNSVRPPA